MNERRERSLTRAASETCRACGTKGVPVQRVTLKALLRGDALRRGVPPDPRFCRTRTCPVVYFDAASEVVFTEDDLTVRVHAKHPHDPHVPVCYCFAVSPGMIRREIERHDESALAAMVSAAVKAGHCACEVRNPKGSCCLGDLGNIEREVKAWLQSERQQRGSI